MKRYISLICCMLILGFTVVGAFDGAFITADALELSVAVGEEYKSSGFYDRLLEVELTGDHRYDAVNIAVSQLGYHEGDCEADMDGLNSKGGRNFAEYTRVWGKVDNREGNGVSYGYAWCAAFVSWCLRQAGVPKDIALTEISCGRMTTWFKNRNMFYAADSGYTPVLGDIIMFADEDSPSHVGFVLGVKDGKVYTIEGNGGEKVATHSYSLTSSYLYGYCVPKYTVKAGMDYAALMNRALNPVGTYIVTANTLDVFEAPSTVSEALGTLSKHDKVEVIGTEGGWSKIKFEDGEGYIISGGILDEILVVYTVSYHLKGGKGEIFDQRKIAGGSVVITGKKPIKTGHDFMGWSTSIGAKTVDYEHGAEYTADADVTLYAVWEPYGLTVTYYNDDGTVFEDINCKYGDILPEPETTPTKESDGVNSYTFAGWDKELDKQVVRNLKYTATFTATPLPEEELSAEDNTAESADGVSAWVIIAVCVALFVGVAVVVFVVLVVKKKKSNN